MLFTFFLQFSLLGCTLWLKLRTISREVIIAENEFRLLVLCLYQTLCPQLYDREIQHYSSVQLSFHAKLLADTAIKRPLATQFFKQWNLRWKLLLQFDSAWTAGRKDFVNTAFVWKMKNADRAQLIAEPRKALRSKRAHYPNIILNSRYYRFER